METVATAEVKGSYGMERVAVTTQRGKISFYAPGWRPMRFEDVAAACRKVASHPGFVRFVES